MSRDIIGMIEGVEWVSGVGVGHGKLTSLVISLTFGNNPSHFK